MSKFLDDKESYVSLETAKLLKEAGFDWRTRRYYSQNGEMDIDRCYFNSMNWNWDVLQHDGVKCSAPTLAVAQKWMREVIGVNVEVMYLFKPCNYYFARACRLEDDSVLRIKNCRSSVYERALEAGIIAALKEEMWLRKQKQNAK